MDRTPAKARQRNTNLKPLREISNLQARALVKFRQVDQQLVRNSALDVRIPNGIIVLQSMSDVIGVQ